MDDLIYTIREQLDRIYAKLAAIDVKLDEKADRSAVTSLEARMRKIEDEVVTIASTRTLFIEEFKAMQQTVSGLEDTMIALRAVSEYRKWLIATVLFGVLSTALGILKLIWP